MTKRLATDDFVTLLSKKARFTKGDTKHFLDALVETLEELSKDGVVLQVRGLGKLYYSKVPPRTIKGYTDKFGVEHPEKILPESRKVIFKLASNIRYSEQDIPISENLDKDDDM